MRLTSDPSPLVFAGGLLLSYLALALLFAVSFSSKNQLPMSRRRPEEEAVHSSNLTRLTNQAVDTLNRGMKRRGSSIISVEKLEKAGLRKQPGDYLLTAASVTFAGVVLGFLLGGVFFAALMLVLTPIGLLLFLNVLIARRRKNFDAQVPDTLQMFAGGLRAGHSLLRSIDAAADESEAPMKEELNRVITETRIGRDLGESLADVGSRTDNDDFRSITRAIEIHREVGGDLAHVLDNVGETIRDRNQIRGQVRALSAEGRMSAIVLMALPVVMFLGLTLFNQLYSKVFLTTVPGYLMIGVAILLLTMGGFWLSKLVKPKF
ncbi:type II secretion system F family protein [Arthrobacter sp. MAHUQ-56]